MVQELMQFEEVGAKRVGKHRGGIRQKYVLSEHGRQLLLNMYDGTPACIDLLVQRVGAPRWKIKKWASELGLARQKEPRWTEQDEDHLRRNLHRSSLADIAKYLHRTKTAVGCDHHKVQKWIERGWLTGRRRKSERTTSQGVIYQLKCTVSQITCHAAKRV
jgi:hypothetical protein